MKYERLIVLFLFVLNIWPQSCLTTSDPALTGEPCISLGASSLHQFDVGKLGETRNVLLVYINSTGKLRSKNQIPIKCLNQGGL